MGLLPSLGHLFYGVLICDGVVDLGWPTPVRPAPSGSAVADDLGQLPGHLREGLLWLLLLGQGLVHLAGDGQAGLVVVGDRRAGLGRVDGLLQHGQVAIAADQALVRSYSYLPVLEQAINSAQPRPAITNYDQASLAISSEVYQALTQQKQPQQALAEMAGQLTQIISDG